MIAMEYIVDKDKTLLTILFDKQILEHLKAKCNDYLILFQSNYNINHFTLHKADTGYRIKRYPRLKKIHKIDISHEINGHNEFGLIECIYFLKKSGFIIIKLRI
jgi:hypothetical protein